jgi:RNA polymerase sigma-70 factor (ECF subfamily)
MLPILAIILASLETEEEKEEFLRLYEQYRHLMFDRAYAILQNEHNAEDAVSIAFVHVAENFHKISAEPCHKQKGFVVTVVENAAKSMYSKYKRERERRVPFDAVAYDLNDGSVLEDQVLASMEVQEALRFIQALPEIDRDVLMLRHIHGCSDQEIARLLKISNDTARKRLERAKRRLVKRWMEEEEHAAV